MKKNPDPQVLVQLIETDWRDIHHSRNQDWQYWIVLAAIGAGLLKSGAKESADTYIFRLACLCVVGTFVSTIAAMISWNHGVLHLKKTSRIDWLEKKIAKSWRGTLNAGLPYWNFTSKHKDKWFVSSILTAMYSTFAIDFAIGVFFSLFPSHPSSMIAVAVLAGVTALTFCLMYCCITRQRQKLRHKYHVYFKL